MNKLRTRFIISFIIVIILMIVIPVVMAMIADYFGLFPEDRRFAQLFNQVPPEILAEFNRLSAQTLPRQLAVFLLIGAGVGTIAGVLLSRSLAKPLDALADAARDIGAQNLSRRVEVIGTDEIADVAKAFNDMASRLEEAETLRRNLLADVAHEIRTPVSVIQGNLRAILDGVYPLEEKEVARLYEQTLHLTRLIDDLRELAQAEAHQLNLDIMTVDVASLVKDTAVTFKPICETEQIELRAELLGKLPPIRADQARLRQSLVNLVDNAIRHTPAQGMVTLQAEQLPGALHLRVIDSGSGIPAEHIDHVFDRFYRIDEARSRNTGGTGLGLAIVKAIAEAHGGTVSVTSHGRGQGSQFTICLPQ